MISLFKVFMNSSVDEELKSVLHSGFISQGKQVEKFEEKLKEYFSYPHLLTLNSATSGLTLALRLIKDKYGPGEVLCTPLTCTATNWPVLANGLDISWVDVDPETCCMDIKDLTTKITEKTRAILFVHWGGTPGNITEIMKIRDEAEIRLGTKISIIEDCAHCFGAEIEDKNKSIKLGTLGNYAVYSFQAIKQLTCGDGGLIILPDENDYNKAKKLRWFGIDREKRSLPGKDFRLEEDIPDWGYKFHMNDINATIGLHNLDHVQKNIEKCRKNAKRYNENFKDLPGIQLLKNNEKDSPWIYSLKVNNKESFISFMNQKNIVVSQVHNRNDNHSCVEKYRVNLPLLDSLEKELICIPVGWWLTDEDLVNIILSVRDWSMKNINIITMTGNEEKYKKDYISLMKEFNGFFEEKNNFESMDKSKIFLLIVSDKVIGSAYIHEENKLYNNLAYIDDVIIKKEYRGKGYGKFFINYLSNILLKKCYKIVLSCKNNKISFYEKCGFVQDGTSMVKRKK